MYKTVYKLLSKDNDSSGWLDNIVQQIYQLYRMEGPCPRFINIRIEIDTDNDSGDMIAQLVWREEKLQ